MPKVSVVVPTHERRALVCRAAESVLSQSLDDLELIVVDDGSTDGTEAALAELRDDRLRYVWQPRAGVTAARNRALGLVEGEIVAFLDSDNHWLPDHLEVLVQVLERHPTAVLATTCPLFTTEGNEEPDDSELLDLWPRVFGYGRYAGYISGVAVRRGPLDQVGGFDERINAGEDTDLFARLGVLGPIATLRRRTLVRGISRTSLKELARRSGDYLRGAELTAANLVATAERLSDDPDLMHEALAGQHMSRAMSALERGEVETVRREFEGAVENMPGLSWSALLVANRVWKHVPMAQERAGLLAAYATVADTWPDRRADTARFIRSLAFIVALRAFRPGEALSLIRGWPRGGNVEFFLRRTDSFRRMAEWVIEERRNRLRAA